MANDDSDRIEAAKLAQEKMAEASRLIAEARELADKHRFMIFVDHYTGFDTRAYFPKGSDTQFPVQLHDDEFDKFSPWCRLDEKVLKLTKYTGEWISSDTYGDCD